MKAFLLAATLGACGAPSAPAPPQHEVAHTPPPERPTATRQDFTVGEAPMHLAVAGGALVWSDSAGAIWTMPTTGRGKPRRLSTQHLAFAFSFSGAGDPLYATSDKDLLRISLAGGTVEKLGAGLPDMPEELVSDASALYCTIFKRDEIMRIPLDGGRPRKLFDFRRGLIAVHAGTLYAVSYSTGALVSIPTTGGTPKPLATGFVRPTALVADGGAAYIYSEKDRTLTRFDFASHSRTVLASELVNADWLVEDGPWLYTVSWPSRLLRVAKDGSRVEDVASDLRSPYGIAVDADAVYVTSRDENRIVRIPKATM